MSIEQNAEKEKRGDVKDEELQSLLTEERETCTKFSINETAGASRRKAVEWILKASAHYGFSSLTSILAVNYLDRFLSSLNFDQEKRPWMMQLAAVACLSLAAKHEETHVPLLLDLQVEDAKYIFEAKTMQRMELLVLSVLKWRMNSVTPFLFLDHMITRIGLKSYIHCDFFRSSENLLLSVISDPRFTVYLPSVLAISTMLHVIHQFEPCNSIDYENQLLKISKEEVEECYELISEVLSDIGLDEKLEAQSHLFSRKQELNKKHIRFPFMLIIIDNSNRGGDWVLYRRVMCTFLIIGSHIPAQVCARVYQYDSRVL